MDNRDQANKGPLDSFLSVFTKVHPGEGVPALLLALNVFVLLGSYYLLKTVREALILSEKGAEVKSYAAAAQAILLVLIIPVYGFIASRVHRIRLITYVTLFFISNLALFYVFGSGGAKVGVPFYIWLGIFNILVVAQFWAFANDVYTESEGKRLFPIIGVGASLGAWVGSSFSGDLFKAFGGYVVMLMAGVGLLVCIFISHYINRREHVSAHGDRSALAEKPLGGDGGFKLVFKHRYLLLIAIMVLLTNLSNTVGEYLFGRLVTEHAREVAASPNATKQLIAGIYGNYFSWVNLLGLLFQLFLASRLFQLFGVRGTLFVLPLIAFGSYGIMAVFPVFRIVRFGKILENATDYSIGNTARHGLFLLTSREAKYKAQAAIETFFWRAGDVLQAGVVLAGTTLGLSVRSFALVNMTVILVWLTVVYAIFREHKRLSEEAEVAQQAA